jgi:flavin reductase (DIM6/NTAB) family NADH-FMN oxidoreductase RutF
MFKEIPLGKSYRLINHGPCVLVSSGNGEKANIAPVAWTTPVNDEPPLVGMPLADEHYTTELINRFNQFVINIPNEELLPAIMHTGKASGRNENKFTAAGLTAVPGVKIDTPHIGECIGFLECTVRERHLLSGVTLFIAEIVHAQADDAVFDECWIAEKAKTVHHLGGAYFATIGKYSSYPTTAHTCPAARNACTRLSGEFSTASIAGGTSTCDTRMEKF